MEVAEEKMGNQDQDGKSKDGKRNQEVCGVKLYLLIRVPINQRYGYISRSKSRICVFHFVDGVTATANPHPIVKLGYSHFEEREKTTLGKKKNIKNYFCY